MEGLVAGAGMDDEYSALMAELEGKPTGMLKNGGTAAGRGVSTETEILKLRYTVEYCTMKVQYWRCSLICLF